MKKVLYLDNYCMFEFTKDEYNTLPTVVIDDIEYKKVKLVNQAVIIAPTTIFYDRE